PSSPLVCTRPPLSTVSPYTTLFRSNTEIVSADSRQFYKEISIGTAKPSDEELLEVKHHFINSHSIQEVYSAGAFERDALSVLEEDRKSTRLNSSHVSISYAVFCLKN